MAVKEDQTNVSSADNTEERSLRESVIDRLIHHGTVALARGPSTLHIHTKEDAADRGTEVIDDNLT